MNKYQRFMHEITFSGLSLSDASEEAIQIFGWEFLSSATFRK